jgi:hypothetical protein
MIPLVFCIVSLGGLAAALAVIATRRRRAAAQSGIRRHDDRPPLKVVDRPYDPSLCDYCDDPSRAACPACDRRLCGLHAPWQPHLFCAGCEEEWKHGGRRRALVLVPVTIGGLIAVTTLGAALLWSLDGGFVSSKLIMLPIFGGIGGSAALYLWLERRWRRRFKRRGDLPSARLRR